MKLFSSSSFFLIIILLHIGVWLVVRNDPFFGDSIASTSKAALAIYDSGFQTFFYPEEVDPGHPTLFPILMALCWSIAGKTLWISHLVGIMCAVFLLWSLRKCCLLFVSVPYANIMVLLSSGFATCLSMSAMMLNTTLLMSFCLLAIYALLSEKKGMFILVTSLMMLTHLQSAYFLTALAVSECWISLRINKQSVWQFIQATWIQYTIPFFVFVFWLILHYQHTGWVLHSPNYSDSQSLKGMGAFVKSIVLILWRLVDYGMLPVHCITATALLRKRIDTRLAAVFCIMLLVTTLMMAITLEHTIGHRYFLVFQLLSIAIAVSYAAQLQKKYLVGCAGLMGISLIAGNFLYYPGKTLGDATLAYRSYFAIEQQLTLDFDEKDSMYSYAPIANAARAKYLTENGLSISRITTDSFNTYPIILQSNVNAEFSAAQKKYLETNWYGKSYEQGAVYVTVFLNPSFYAKPEGWLLRTPSWTEQQIINFKSRFGR
jgi:EpsG family